MSTDYPARETQEAHQPTTTTNHAAALSSTSRFAARVVAYCGDAAARAFSPMETALWKKQGLSARDAAERPPAAAFRYHGSNAYRAVFDAVTRISEGKKVRELDGVWLRTGTVEVDVGGGKRELRDVMFDPPQPLLPGLARNANHDPDVPLYITDREDVAVILAASGGAVIGVATGATLFANPENVDIHTPDRPRALHTVCDNLPIGKRDITFIYEDRTAAVTTARGLRQGDGHTGSVRFLRTSNFLSQIDSAIAQGLSMQELKVSAFRAAEQVEEDLLPAVTSGNPGSIGMRVPSALLTCLPTFVRDFYWPAPEGGGTSWDNLDWGLTRNGNVTGIFRDQKGDEFTLHKPVLTLLTPIYVTQRFATADPEGEEHVELMWAENGAAKSIVLPSRHVFGGSGQEMLKAGVPITDSRRAGQWFNAFRAANPKIPTQMLHTQSGWLHTPQGWRFLLPDADIPGHHVQKGVLSGVTRAGSALLHWELIRDFYAACDPLNQILLMAPHASLLIAALRLQGCVFGLVDDSSRGKTVLLQTSARQYGWDGGDYAFDASNPPTAAFLERVVQRSNGLCIFIDEFHKFPNTRKEASGNTYTRQEAAYFLSNGQRRGRSNAAGGIDTSTQRVYCYSIVAGEKKHITATDRAAQMDGARVRMVTVPLIGYAPHFLTKYGGLSGFMNKANTVKGHVGLAIAEAMGQEISARSMEDMREEVGEVVNKIFALGEAACAANPKLADIYRRRATFLAPICYTEMLLARLFPGEHMWSRTFENTCVVRALRGPHREQLMAITTNEAADSVANDDITASNMLLEVLRRDPRLIQGLREHTDREGRAHPHNNPLARLSTGRAVKYAGLRLYPKAVMQVLRHHGISETAARDLLRNSGDFVLQEGRDGAQYLVHRSNGETWFVPVAGWGWDLLLEVPGDPATSATDPYSTPRKAFEAKYVAAVATAQDELTALHKAIDATLDQIQDTSPPPKSGTLESQLLLGYGPAWRALIVPLVDRLVDKEECPDLEDMWVTHVQRRCAALAVTK